MNVSEPEVICKNYEFELRTILSVRGMISYYSYTCYSFTGLRLIVTIFSECNFDIVVLCGISYIYGLLRKMPKCTHYIEGHLLCFIHLLTCELAVITWQ